LGENNNAYRISKELVITLANVNIKLLTAIQNSTNWLRYEMEIKIHILE
jgi:hypothetical protein